MSAKKKKEHICVDCGDITTRYRRVKSWAPGTTIDAYRCMKCHEKAYPGEGKAKEHSCEENDMISETPIRVLQDRSDRLARLTHKLRVFSSNCEIRAKIALEHSRITKNQTLHTVETSQAAILIQTYETIRHFLNNPDEPQEEETKSVTESEPMGECDFCDSPAAYAPGLCSNCAERFRE